MRRLSPAVQPRMIPACRSRTPRPLTAGRPVVQSACPPAECPGFNGGESRTGSSGLRDERPTTGDGAEQASNTARGTPWVWRTCGTNKRFDKPRCREASRPVGPFGPLASRAPSVGGGRQETRTTGLLGASTKNTGDGAWACRTLLRAFLKRREARTGNTCDCLATGLEHLSHTLRWHQWRRDSAIPFNDIGAR